MCHHVDYNLKTIQCYFGRLCRRPPFSVSINFPVNCWSGTHVFTLIQLHPPFNRYVYSDVWIFMTILMQRKEEGFNCHYLRVFIICPNPDLWTNQFPLGQSEFDINHFFWHMLPWILINYSRINKGATDHKYFWSYRFNYFSISIGSQGGVFKLFRMSQNGLHLLQRFSVDLDSLVSSPAKFGCHDDTSISCWWMNVE